MVPLIQYDTALTMGAASSLLWYLHHVSTEYFLFYNLFVDAGVP